MIPAGAIPVLPLRNTVLYPGVIQTLRVGRDKSIRSIEKAQSKNGWIIAITQKQPENNIQSVVDVYEVGTLAKIETMRYHNDGGYTINIRGYYRVRLNSFVPESDVFEVHPEQIEDLNDIDLSTQEALAASVKTLSKEILKMIPGNTEQLRSSIEATADLVQLNYLCATNSDFLLSEKQQILEISSIKERTMSLLNLLQKFKESLKIQSDIRTRLHSNIGQNQREQLLREQMKAIKEELGEKNDDQVLEKLREKLDAAGLPPEAKELADNQFRKLEQSNPNSPDYQMTRTHLELMAGLPWSQSSGKEEIDLDAAAEILNQDHYGLDKIKKRILQHLAVMKLKKDKKGSILLFIGPPGVGKTSLGQSIAKALGKKYTRLSLGGVRDEAEIRGHRRTYIGALPGKIISAIKKAGENDPVMILDEIDKLSRTYGGDPSSAMLEVLDPEQNHTFMDHYLDTAFDISNIFFIATANSLDGIPAPLLDRMEVIDLTGYTLNEKLHIAKTHLVPKQLEAHGLKVDQVQIGDEILKKVIQSHTRESGVRDLQRKIIRLCLHFGEQIIKNPEKVFVVHEDDLEPALGAERFSYDEVLSMNPPGVVNGLAWTPFGGDILFIETALLPGKGNLIITGQLGDVMKESAQIAMSLIKARMPLIAPTLDINKFDIHLHVPAGAIPKDGPSAGVTLLTSLASLFSRQSVDSKLAMTGEISLRGAVLPVGGIKEKVIAAHRAGITKIILCAKNQRDLKEVPEEIKSQIEFVFANDINDVLKHALNFDLRDITMSDYDSATQNNPPLVPMA